MILEAMHTVGVICSYWSDFIEEGYADIYEMISYRHLLFQRTSETMSKLSNFIKVVSSQNEFRVWKVKNMASIQ